MPGASGTWKPRDEQLADWWEKSGTRNYILPALQGAFPTLPGGMLSNLVQSEGENLVNLLGGQRSPSEAYAASPVMQGFVEPIASFGSMVGRALQNPRSLYDIDQETGEAHLGQKPIEAAAGAAMTIPMAGLASGAGRAGVLASGPKLQGLKSELQGYADYLGMSVDDLAQNVMNNPENWPSLAHLEPSIEAAVDETFLGAHGLKPVAENQPPLDFPPMDAGPPATPLEYLTQDEVNHLYSLGHTDADIAGWTMDQAFEALDNTNYYPHALGGENWQPTMAGGKPAPLSPDYQTGELHPGGFLEQKPFYTGDEGIDNQLSLAKDKGWDPHALAHYYQTGNLSDGDLLFHSTVTADEVGPGALDHLKPTPAGLAGTPEEIMANLKAMGAGEAAPYDPGVNAPYYTGDPKVDSLINKAEEKGWDPDEIAHSYLSGEIDDTDLMFHSLVKAEDTPGGPHYDPLKKADPLKLKPLQKGIAPWAQTPSVPNPIDFTTGKYQHPPPTPGMPLYKHNEDWRAIFGNLYETGANENELIKEFLGNQGNERGRVAGEKLLAMRPKGSYDFGSGRLGDPERSLIVPHGFYARGTGWKDRVEEFLAKGFPGDPATEQRAIGGGFNPDPKSYKWHASDYPALRFLDPESKPRSRAAFLAETPEVAREYGKYLYPIMPRLENPLVKDWGGLRVDYNNMMRDFLEKANAEGYESAIGLNILDVGPSSGGDVEHQTMLIKPHHARSPWAQFDPAKRWSADWLAGGGVPFNPFDFLAGAQPGGQAPAPAQFETTLSPEQETQFQQWKAQFAPRDSGYDYDLRGAYMAGLRPDPKSGHWPDTFKKPNHPTFSNQSIYSTPEHPGGMWVEDEYHKVGR